MASCSGHAEKWKLMLGAYLNAKSNVRTLELHEGDQGKQASLSAHNANLSAIQERDKNSIITEMTILNVRGILCKCNLNEWIAAKIHH